MEAERSRFLARRGIPQISECLLVSGSAFKEGLTDSDDMRCVTISGIGSRRFAGPRGPCWRHGGGQSAVRRSRLVLILRRRPLARSARALWRLEDRLIQRFNRWAKSGVFERVFRLLASDHDNEYMMIDATIVRAHQHSAGAQKNTARKPSADPAAD